MKTDLYRSEDRREQLRAENISMMKRLHWFDKKLKKFKGIRLRWKRRKLDETFVLRWKRAN